ncbi:MAG: methylmalonyl Co-A mutase-associated GTPase MeaB, partial [Thermoanaerobaculia bacterium]
VGVTGVPGAGKSTLVDALAGAYRGAGERVGVVAVDPSSAFSGGALLGDRIRMQRHSTDPGVFIRSMATRQHLGGLAEATPAVVDLLDAAGHRRILIETVGVGQDEIEVVDTADTVVVALVPGLGDDIQAIKAGVLEIADVFVINKADREGVERLQQELETLMTLGERKSGEWEPPIVRTVATEGKGIEDLRGAIERHAADAGAKLQRRERRRLACARRLWTLLEKGLVRRLQSCMPLEQLLETQVSRVLEREKDPYSAAESILAEVRVTPC